MAELTTPNTAMSASGCCASAVQQTCCEPSEKSACCETGATGAACGCIAGQTTPAAGLRELVRERYAAAALASTDATVAAGCCADGALISD